MVTVDPGLRASTPEIVRHKRISSTNDRAHLLADQGASEWTIVTAEIQTSGRGRRGKRWESPKGGLWFSIILRPDISTHKLGLLQFLVSNSARRALKKETAVSVQVKWPNDLVHSSGKVGGILVESKSAGDKVSFVIVGVGLNVNLREAQLPTGATSTYLLSGRKHSLEKLLAAIVKDMRSMYSSLGEPSRILDEWWRNCIHRSKRVQVETLKGPVSGVNIGLGPQGLLLVDTGKTVKRLLEGTLRILDN